MSRFDRVIRLAEKQIKYQEGTHIPAEIYWKIVRNEVVFRHGFLQKIRLLQPYRGNGRKGN